MRIYLPIPNGFLRGKWILISLKKMLIMSIYLFIYLFSKCNNLINIYCMKKILMLCSIAFILSCSNDSDVKNEYLNTNESLNVQSKSGSSVETPKVEDDID